MLACCCAEDADKKHQMDFAPVGVPALSAGPHEVPHRVETKLGARTDHADLSSPFSKIISKPEEPPRRQESAKAVEAQDEYVIQEPYVEDPPAVVVKQPSPKAKAVEPKQAPPDDAGETFEVTLSTDQSLGLKLFVMPAAIVVAATLVGAVASYNHHAEPSKQVRPYDMLVGVNGMCTHPGMIYMLKGKDGPISTLLIFRPKRVSITVSKLRAPLGITTQLLPEPTMSVKSSPTSSGNCLLRVASVHGDGPMALHNRKCNAGEEVNVNDCIISVNGVADDAAKMHKLLEDPSVSEITMVRLRPRAL